MPFSHRVFCRDRESPSLSDLLVCLRQHRFDTRVSGGRSAGDLLSCYWEEVELTTGSAAGQGALRLECLRADASGGHSLAAELADFRDDVTELPPSSARARVLDQLAATRSLLVVEFPATDVASDAEDIAGSITELFAERARGLVQRDGVGFVDEDDDLVLSLG